jgi:DNA-binding response OmpR family regulator
MMREGLPGLLKLLARVESLLRRCEQLAGRDPIEHLVLRFGTVEMDRPARKVLRDGIPVSLRPKEYDLLLQPLLRRGSVVSRHDLMKAVWAIPRP